MLTSRRNDSLYLIGVREQTICDHCSRVTFLTTRGDLVAHTRIAPGTRRAAILLDGDDHEPRFTADYMDLAVQLGEQSIGSVRLEYREPGDVSQCAIDALLVCQYLDDEGISDVALAGWSFGAAVALAAGSVARVVRCVAALSPVELSETCVRRMGRKPLLIVSGQNDCSVPSDSARRALQSKDGPASLLSFPDQGHDLAGVRRQVRSDLLTWMCGVFDSSQLHKHNPAAQAYTY